MTQPMVGKVLHPQCRQVIYNVYTYYKTRKLDNKTTEFREDINVIDVVAQATGVSKSSVSRVIRDGNAMKAKSGIVLFKEENKRNHVRKKRVAVDKRLEGMIRTKVIQFYDSHKEVPSIRQLNMLLKEEKIVKCSNEYLRQLLVKLGLTDVESNAQGTYVPRCNVNSERLNYLQTVKDSRVQDKNILFFDDTSLYEKDGDSVLPSMPDYIAVHASGKPGYLNGTRLMMKPKTETAYKIDQRCTDNVEKYVWVKEFFLSNLPPSAVIIMNTPFIDCTKLQKPSVTSTRIVMQEWLTAHKISFKDTDSKSDLIKLISKKNMQVELNIEKLLRDNGHEVIHLPESNFELNPIRVVWNTIRKDTVLTTPECLFENYTQENWQKCLDRVIQTENEYYEIDSKCDGMPRDFISITVKTERDDECEQDEDTNESDDSEDEDMDYVISN